jgi:DNA modification methylase
MSVYYEDESVTLYHGDCREVTSWLEADVLVTDPPYGMAYSGFGGRKGEPRRTSGPLSIAGDADAASRDQILSLWGDRPALVFGTWRIARPPATRQVIVWDKSANGPGMGALDVPWGPSHEEVYVLGSGWTGKRGGSVYRDAPFTSADASRPDHPTPKPTSLMERLIAHTVGTVADPFAGSGSTLVAAKQLGRKAIGVELEERYCELIAKRLAQGVLDFGDAS